MVVLDTDYDQHIKLLYGSRGYRLMGFTTITIYSKGGDQESVNNSIINATNTARHIITPNEKIVLGK